MNRPYFTAGGVAAAPAATPAPAPTSAPAKPPPADAAPPRTVAEVLAESQVEAVLDELDRDLIGLAPIKQRIRDIAALLVIDKLRANLGLQAGARYSAPSLHRSLPATPAPARPRWRCAWRKSCTAWAIAAKATWWR